MKTMHPHFPNNEISTSFFVSLSYLRISNVAIQRYNIRSCFFDTQRSNDRISCKISCLSRVRKRGGEIFVVEKDEERGPKVEGQKGEKGIRRGKQRGAY